LIVPLTTSTTYCQDNNLACCAGYASSADRSVTIYLINMSEEDIYFNSATLYHGAWTPDCSATTIDTVWNDNAIAIASGSNEYLSGTEGLATFIIGNYRAYFTISWDNPYVGSSSFSIVLSDTTIYSNETISYGWTDMWSEFLESEDLTDNEKLDIKKKLIDADNLIKEISLKSLSLYQDKYISKRINIQEIKEMTKTLEVQQE
ncbi:3765_t:CDS:2, partial [Dentiscutata heterogama]